MAHRLLHDTLHATILEADKLTHRRRPRDPPQGFEETIGRGKGSTRLYATIDLGRASVGRTRVLVGDPVNPRWYEDFHIYCAHFAADVVFTVKAAQPIGRAYLPVRELLDADGNEIERRLDILDATKQKLPHGPTIHVRLGFCDVTSSRREGGAGVGSARHPGVPYTFFSQRPGCRVTLYQTRTPRTRLRPGSRSPAAGATSTDGAGRTCSMPSPTHATWCTSSAGRCTPRSR
ncbi:hypothetical protein ZWY2020_045493 [Hordeum vulgare]|nr:hypothetical protein ZWY2020_045493 [Hordeum vulgare]